MDCSGAYSRFIFYREGSLSGDEMNEFSDHLKTCRKCSLIYAEFEKTYDLIEHDKNPEDDYYFLPRFMEKLESGTATDKSWSNWTVFIPNLRPALIAFSILIIMTAGIFIGQKLNSIPSRERERETVIDNYASELYINEINDNKWEQFLTAE